MQQKFFLRTDRQKDGETDKTHKGKTICFLRSLEHDIWLANGLGVNYRIGVKKCDVTMH